MTDLTRAQFEALRLHEQDHLHFAGRCNPKPCTLCQRRRIHDGIEAFFWTFLGILGGGVVGAIVLGVLATWGMR